MALEISNHPLQMTLHGFSGVVENRNYPVTGRQLMDKLWQEIRSKSIKNKGLNVWVYDNREHLFCGVELEQPVPADSPLETKPIFLQKYAKWKHIGPYTKLTEGYSSMHRALKEKEISFHFPLFEIYGHWNDDENKLETDIIYTID